MAEKFFIAQDDLYVAPFVRAHRAGDLVHEDSVKANGWADSVKAAPAAAVPADLK